MYKPDCFAFRNTEKPYCDALTELKCDDCRFYKALVEDLLDFKEEENSEQYANRILREVEFFERRNRRR